MSDTPATTTDDEEPRTLPSTAPNWYMWFVLEHNSQVIVNSELTRPGMFYAADPDDLIHKLRQAPTKFPEYFLRSEYRGKVFTALTSLCIAIFQNQCKARADFYMLIHFTVLLPFFHNHTTMFEALNTGEGGDSKDLAKDCDTIANIWMELHTTMLKKKLMFHRPDPVVT